MENEVVFKLNPSYNFIYELFMPTGKKTNYNIKFLLISLLLLLISTTYKEILNFKLIDLNQISLTFYNFIIVMVAFLIIFFIVKLIVQIVLQYANYKNIEITFYKDYLTYNDKFLNQQIKTIYYSNVKEIEIRRNIWDRINGYGIIIIYTNAENTAKNGLVLFGIKNSNETYQKIDNLIHNK